MEITLGLFLLPQGRPCPRFSTTMSASISTTSVSAMEILQWIVEQAQRNPNQFGGEDNVVAKINSGRLGFTGRLKSPYL
jgi:hypothetical protein